MPIVSVNAHSTTLLHRPGENVTESRRGHAWTKQIAPNLVTDDEEPNDGSELAFVTSGEQGLHPHNISYLIEF